MIVFVVALAAAGGVMAAASDEPSAPAFGLDCASGETPVRSLTTFERLPPNPAAPSAEAPVGPRPTVAGFHQPARSPGEAVENIAVSVRHHRSFDPTLRFGLLEGSNDVVVGRAGEAVRFRADLVRRADGTWTWDGAKLTDRAGLWAWHGGTAITCGRLGP